MPFIAAPAAGRVDGGHHERTGTQVPAQQREDAHAALSTLSAQELQIARMVAEGMSNREIGERLYLSPRTIGSHLYYLVGFKNRVSVVLHWAVSFVGRARSERTIAALPTRTTPVPVMQPQQETVG